MRHTSIVFQYPLALPDVYRWAADNKFELTHDDANPIYKVVREDEIIILGPIDYLVAFGPCDKLVLWGAFTREDLKILSQYME